MVGLTSPPPYQSNQLRTVSSLVPAAGLLGRNAKETALVDQWVHFAESEILAPASTIYIGVVPKYLPAFGKEVCLC